MGSIKIVLTIINKKNDGKVPVSVPVIKNGKPSYILTSNYSLTNNWNATE